MSRVVFFYFNGTDFALKSILKGGGEDTADADFATVAGLDRTAAWVGGGAKNDCFTSLLDPNIFEAYHVAYPSAAIGMTQSIVYGITKLSSLINRLPNGQKYMIGGYSQGAAVAGMAYDKIRNGELGDKAARDFLGGVNFGSPVRETNFRGEVGGTWSGSWDVGLSTRGGHGCFPATGPIPRLTNCDPTKWIEFAEYDDVITSVGDSPNGSGWVSYVGLWMNVLNPFNSLPAALRLLARQSQHQGSFLAAFNLGGKTIDLIDAAGKPFSHFGNGHVAYPFRPPPGDPDNGLTSFQIAIKWLESRAREYATAPILMQSSPSGTSSATAGWTTSLTAP